MTSYRDRLVVALQQSLAGDRRPAFPEGSAPLWQWFCDLSAGRSWHAAGPNSIAYADIEAYARLTRWPIAPHHVALLRAMDAAFIEHYSRPRGAPEGVKNMPPVSDRPMTAELFDAIFG